MKANIVLMDGETRAAVEKDIVFDVLPTAGDFVKHDKITGWVDYLWHEFIDGRPVTSVILKKP
jgi:hypothetical protein